MTRSNILNLIAYILLVGSLSISVTARSATHTIINLGELTAEVLGYDHPNWGEAYDINEAGQIVGHWQDNAFFYDPIAGMNGRPINDPRPMDSYLTGLNNSGLAVGYISGCEQIIYDFSSNSYYGTGEYFCGGPDIDDSGNIIERTYAEMLAEYTGPTDLFALLPTNPGWDSLTPVAMNSSGQIVGWGQLTDYPRPWESFPFLMTPVPIPPAIVAIDIKPGSAPVCNGTIPVAILGSDTLDVIQIDQTTLSFEGLGVRERRNGALSCNIRDVNRDGYTDLVCRYQDTTTEGTLTGELLDGTPVEGADTFCVVN